jgi:hypothetical protein
MKTGKERENKLRKITAAETPNSVIFIGKILKAYVGGLTLHGEGIFADLVASVKASD